MSLPYLLCIEQQDLPVIQQIQRTVVGHRRTRTSCFELESRRFFSHLDNVEVNQYLRSFENRRLRA